MRKVLYSAFMMLCVGLFPQSAVYADPIDQAKVANTGLNLVIFPRRNVKTSFRMFQPMADYLSKTLGRDVNLSVPKDFQTFWDVLKKGQFDLIHMNQYHYIDSRYKYGYQAILKNIEFGSSTMSGVIMVRKDSGINNLGDLKGKKILFGGGPRAMQSYIIPTWLLRNAGLRKGEYTELFAKNPPNALISAFHHQADAAGVGNAVLRLKIVKNSVNIAQMKTLISGPELPQLVWAVKETMPEDLKIKIQKELSTMVQHTEGQVVLDKAQLTGLAIATDEEYDPYLHIVDQLLTEREREASQ